MLSDGQSVEADLFIDASGAEAALIGASRRRRFESWRHWLPCRPHPGRLGPRLTPLPAFSQISAYSGGWIGLHPLQNRTAMKCVYDSSGQSDEEMADAIGAPHRFAIEGDAVVSPWSRAHAASLDRQLRRGRRSGGRTRAARRGAAAPHPLGLSHLVALFPVDADEMPEADAYNADIAAHSRNIRDFQIAHYKLNRRFDEPFWDRAREPTIPDSLAHKLDLFASAGMSRSTTTRPSRARTGRDLRRPRPHARATIRASDALPREEQIAKFQGKLRVIAEVVRAMPSLDAHLEIPRPTAARAPCDVKPCATQHSQHRHRRRRHRRLDDGGGTVQGRGHPELSITLVESEEIGTVGVGEATIPLIRMFNKMLGIDEDEFVRETNATFKLGIEFVDWRRLGPQLFPPVRPVRRRHGRRGSSNIGCAGCKRAATPITAVQRRSRGGPPGQVRAHARAQSRRRCRTINYAFQFDASLYAAYLRRYAEKRGVVRIEGRVVNVAAERRDRLHRGASS